MYFHLPVCLFFCPHANLLSICDYHPTTDNEDIDIFSLLILFFHDNKRLQWCQHRSFQTNKTFFVTLKIVRISVYPTVYLYFHLSVCLSLSVYVHPLSICLHVSQPETVKKAADNISISTFVEFWMTPKIISMHCLKCKDRSTAVLTISSK